MRKDSHVDRRITQTKDRQSDKTVAPACSRATSENDQAHHYAPFPSGRAIAGCRVLEPADDLGLARRRRPAGGNQKDGARKQGAVPSPNRRIKIGPSTDQQQFCTQPCFDDPARGCAATAGTIRNAAPIDYFDTARGQHGMRALAIPRLGTTLRPPRTESSIKGEPLEFCGRRSGRGPAGKGPLKNGLQAEVGKRVFEI